MIRIFCDNCGREPRPYEHERCETRYKNMRVQVIVGTLSGWNDGHFCHDCIREAVASTELDAIRKERL